MEKLTKLVELCKQRQQLFQTDSFDYLCLFNSYDFDEKYQAITKTINKVAKSLNIYTVTVNPFETSVAFLSLNDLKNVVGDMELTKTYDDFIDQVQYSIAFFDCELKLYCFEKEEHKKAQAI